MSEIKRQLISRARSLGCKVSQDFNSHWIIECSTNKEELILKEEEMNKWLWISNKTPQAFLKTNETLEILKKLTKNKYFNPIKILKSINIAG